MSIDKSTMKIFFEAMEGIMIGSGYSSKIVTTPMGPFKWNSATELWENVNNGMVVNNISFQDMMMLGYETNSGDNGNFIIDNCIYSLGWNPINLGNNIILSSYPSYILLGQEASDVGQNTCPTRLYLNVSNILGDNPELISGMTYYMRGATGSTLMDSTRDITDFNIPVLLGITGTDIVISPNNRFGPISFLQGENGITSEAAIIMSYAGSSYGNFNMRVSLYNENESGITLYTGRFVFNNTDFNVNLTGSLGNLGTSYPTGMTLPQTTYWSTTSGPTLDVNDANTTTFGDEITPFVTIGLTWSFSSGNRNLEGVVYSKDGGGTEQYSTPFTAENGTILKIGAITPKRGTEIREGIGQIKLLNLSYVPSNPNYGQVIDGITWAFEIQAE